MGIERIKLNLIPAGTMPVCHASQYDKKRQIGIDIYNGLQPYILSDELLELDVRKPDGHIVTVDVPYTAGGNGVVFETTEQMCAVAGANLCELKITKGEAEIGSINFFMEVEKSPLEGGLPSDSDIENLRTQMQAIAEPMVEEIVPPIVEELVPQVIGDGYYTAEETDEAIATATEGKADKSNTYTKTEVDSSLNAKMDKANPTGTGSFSLNRKANTPVGYNSVAIGNNNEASGTYSFAEGNNTTASGSYSHAEGIYSTASASSAHAEGIYTTASGQNSHAEGYETTASRRSQHVFGEWNEVESGNSNTKGTYVEIVGNGRASYLRGNARTLDWQGNETLAGDLTINGNQSVSGEITRLDGKIDNLPAPMIFKGTLGTGGTISTLPAASTSNEGYTYKVITDGTYAGQTAKVGDVFTSNGSEWVLIPAGDEDNDTWRAIKVNGVEKLGNGISSGAVDFEDTANVKFEFDANGNKVRAKLDGIYTENEVDDLLDDKADADNTYTKAQVDDIVYNILPDDTASGSVANFNTSLEMPIKSLEVDVNAVQASGTPTPASPLPISGWSAISVAQRGTNLWDEVWELGAIDNQTGQNADNNNTYRSKNYIQIPKGVNLYLVNGNSDTLGLRFYDSNKNFIGSRAFLTSKVMTYGTNDLLAGTAYIRFVNTSTNVYLNNVAINYPSSDTEYHAYSPNSQEVIIALGDTYYGGHLTQDKAGHRQFEVTHGCNVYIGADSENWSYNGTRFSISVLDMQNSTSRLNVMCNRGYYHVNATTDGVIFGYAKSLYYYLSSETSVEAFKTWLSNNNLQVVYPLETPYYIDLPDGEPIVTLNGTNNIFADTGDTSVVFKSSVADFVNAHSGGGGAKSLGGVFLGSSNNNEEEPDEGEDTEKTKLDETKVEVKEIGDDSNIKKLGGE